MPAEWAQHASTWLSWPHNETTWPGKLLKEAESVYLQMMEALLLHEKVNLLVPSNEVAHHVMKSLDQKKARTSNLVMHEVFTVDAWIRDYGPIFLKGLENIEKKAFVKWVFNAWGGKYDDLAQDNVVVDHLSFLTPIQRFNPGIILEGGSIDVNGEGLCLTTQQCLLNSNRNSKLSKSDIESYLNQYLGVQKVIWLKEGIEGDDTDGHIDDITRFVNPTTVVTATENNPNDKNHRFLKENLEILKSVTDQNEKSLKIVEIPMPGRVNVQGTQERLPASYANFYIANQTVLVPLYSHANDKIALHILQEVFPNRKVIGIECTALVHGLGSIHCVTQQEPQ